MASAVALPHRPRSPWATGARRRLRHPPLSVRDASSTYLFITGCQPRHRVDRLAVMAQLQIKTGLVFALRHRADRLAGHQPLSDGAIDPLQPRQKRMISVAMFNDQDLPIAPERPGEKHAAVEGRDDLAAAAGLEGNAFAGDAELVILAVAS